MPGTDTPRLFQGAFRQLNKFFVVISVNLYLTRGYYISVDTIEYDYPSFHLSMDCFWAKIVSGDLILKEHAAAKWLAKDELDSVEWLPADITLIEKIKRAL